MVKAAVKNAPPEHTKKCKKTFKKRLAALFIAFARVAVVPRICL